jgi:hypothetical protein
MKVAHPPIILHYQDHNRAQPTIEHDLDALTGIKLIVSTQDTTNAYRRKVLIRIASRATQERRKGSKSRDSTNITT